MPEAVARTINPEKKTDLVSFTIKVEGEEAPLSLEVKSIIITKEVNKIPVAKIRINDGDPAKEDFETSNQELFIPGKSIELEFGYRSENTTLFKGIITSHSNRVMSRKSELVVECKDKTVMLTLARKSRHYNDMTDSEIAENILTQYGIEKEIEATSITHKNLVQYNLSDWDFILTRQDVIGHICLVNDGKVRIQKPDLNGEPVLDVLFGATILEYEAELDARLQYQSLQAASWNYSTQEVIEIDATEPAITTELGNISATTLAEEIGADNFKLTHAGKLTQEELQALANAKLQKQRLAKIRGRVMFEGFPEVLPGQHIKLHGVGDRFNGPVFVNGVKHSFSEGLWTTEVSFGVQPEWFAEAVNPYHPGATMGLIPSVQGLMIGIVSDLEDPEGEDRVRVKLPVVSTGEQGIWARVAAVDAGNERGMFFRPEVGDEVVVGFIQNDPSQMVILGMLHSSAKPAPFAAENANHEKGYVSREKMKMVFNDSEKSFKIETPAGKKITVSEQENIISIEDENSNKITLDSSGITIESAAALTLKGGTTVKVEAPSISVNGSAKTEIKGGVVQIN